MIVGLDIDGTISEFPPFFSLISKAILLSGGEVHIITYRCAADEEFSATKKELQDWGIEWTKVHLPPEGVVSAPSWKCELVESLGVEIMFEDSPEVLAALPSHVTRLWLCNFFDLDKCISALS